MHTPRSGFTLVEMIVSVGLFAIVMLVATGAYLQLISLDRKARATNDLVTNLSFAVDSIERELRTGSDFRCGSGTNCGSGDTSFTFTDDKGQTITYSFNQGTQAVDECIDSSCSAITDPRVHITNLRFYLRGVGTTVPNNVTQPWVFFTLVGSITPDSQSAPITFSIQSTASQRAIEL